MKFVELPKRKYFIFYYFFIKDTRFVSSVPLKLVKYRYSFPFMILGENVIKE